MPSHFRPTAEDVQRYRRLRALGMELNHRITKTVPRQAYEEVGDAIGIRRNGVLVFENPDMSSVLMDCCLYDWFENGRNVVERYAEAHPAKPGTEEGYLLEAYLQAKYGVLVAQSAAPGAGLHCQDILNTGELFLMDLGLSQSSTGANAVFATRTIPLGEYWMTGGAGLPIGPKKAALDVLSRIESGESKSPRAPGSVALSIVRACLAAGAARHVAYASVPAKPAPPPCRARRR